MSTQNDSSKYEYLYVCESASHEADDALTVNLQAFADTDTVVTVNLQAFADAGTVVIPISRKINKEGVYVCRKS